MSRLAFARRFGAEPHNARNAWSYVNHDKRFVLFGAWSHHEESDRQLVFSKLWDKDANSRRPASYGPSLRHIEHVLEDGYSLYTFRQYAVSENPNEIPRIDHFDDTLEERRLVVVGTDYFAVKTTDPQASTVEIEPTMYSEGARFDVVQTHFERNRQARDKCIEINGPVCAVCEMDFQSIYGDIGSGFIHVHHIVRVADRKTQYKINPAEDLVPVCPNCHAMLHKQTPPFSVQELKDMMAEKAKMKQ
ncbi:HNH endonuclease [Roseovarius sp. E0-M6]|uniref:HNH endonuclease n=1 Tax=Roseovarius sp. E0-M6 TaxID=3127118 RepID=UPI0030105A52